MTQSRFHVPRLFTVSQLQTGTLCGNVWRMETVTQLNMQRMAKTLDVVLSLAGVSNSELGRRLGEVPQWVQQRRRAHTRIKADELPLIADALGIPVEVLTMTRSDAARWFAEWYAARDSNPEPTDFGLIPLPGLELVAA